jgi:hypothetical protein
MMAKLITLKIITNKGIEIENELKFQDDADNDKIVEVMKKTFAVMTEDWQNVADALETK